MKSAILQRGTHGSNYPAYLELVKTAGGPEKRLPLKTTAHTNIRNPSRYFFFVNYGISMRAFYLICMDNTKIVEI